VKPAIRASGSRIAARTRLFEVSEGEGYTMVLNQADEGFAWCRGAAARSYMLKRGNLAGKCAFLLATCFCLFTFAQTARPLESIALSSHPGVSAKYHALTRHTLKEVGGRAVDLSAAATTESGTLTVEGPPQLSRLNPAEVADWCAQTAVPRRIPPPPPDDTH